MRMILDVREPPDGTGLIGKRSIIERNQIWHPKSVGAAGFRQLPNESTVWFETHESER
jgi:hypothetical protein